MLYASKWEQQEWNNKKKKNSINTTESTYYTLKLLTAFMANVNFKIINRANKLTNKYSSFVDFPGTASTFEMFHSVS